MLKKYAYCIYVEFDGVAGHHHTFIKMFKTKDSALKYFVKFWNSRNSSQFPNGILSLEKTERGFSYNSKIIFQLKIKAPFSIHVLTLDDIKKSQKIPLCSSFGQIELDLGCLSSLLTSDDFRVSEVFNEKEVLKK